MQNTRIVFFGSSSIGEAVLQTLLDRAEEYHYEIVGVVTKKDALAGRSMEVKQNEVKQLALQHNIPVIDGNESIVPFLEEHGANLAIVYSYGSLIKSDVLGYFNEPGKYGLLNIHTSYLPAFRGAIPVQMAIFSGLGETGVSIIQVGEKMDAGNILAQQKVSIESHDTLGTLTTRLYTTGTALLFDHLAAYIAGTATLVSQDESQATFCYIKDLETIYAVGLNDSAQLLDRAIRSIAPDAYISLTISGKPMQIYEAQVVPEADVAQEVKPGELVSWKEHGTRRILVRCGKDFLEIMQAKPQGKKLMNAADLWNGYLQNR